MSENKNNQSKKTSPNKEVILAYDSPSVKHIPPKKPSSTTKNKPKK